MLSTRRVRVEDGCICGLTIRRLHMTEISRRGLTRLTHNLRLRVFRCKADLPVFFIHLPREVDSTIFRARYYGALLSSCGN